jgi:hypothetical protein
VVAATGPFSLDNYDESMTTLDVILIVAAGPGLLVLFTPWLLWERWIPWFKIPRLALGPYVLYLAFIAWHFGWPLWAMALLDVAGALLLLVGAMERRFLPWLMHGPCTLSLAGWAWFVGLPWLTVVLSFAGAIMVVVTLINRATNVSEPGPRA